jgi:hypothetical protein
MPVRAKFLVESKTIRSHGRNADGSAALITDIELRPVMANSPENKEFWRWSPSGSIKLGCTNQAASDQFEIGAEYYIDFVKA